MNKFEFASSVIKAPGAARLTDRAFAVPVLFSCLVWYAAFTGKTSFDTAISFTQWAIGPVVIAEKAKDALVAFGALQSPKGPETVSAAGDVNMANAKDSNE